MAEQQRTTRPLTLTEFLRARMDDKEQAYRIGARTTGMHRAHSQDRVGVLRADCPDCHNVSPALLGQVRAEIQAVRDILDDLVYGDESDISLVDYWLTGNRVEFAPPIDAAIAIGVAKHLAQPFADHPDYNSDWRP